MRIYMFIEKALNPVAFTSEENRAKYEYLFEGTNKALLLAGMEVTKEGKLVEVVQAKTLDEVDRRVNSLKRELYNMILSILVDTFFSKISLTMLPVP